MEEKYLAQLVEWIQSTSPLLLAAAKQKVAANLTMNVIWVVAASVSMIFPIWGMRHASAKHKDGDYLLGYSDRTFAMLISGTGIMIAMAIITLAATEALEIWLAPDYATIQILTDLAKSTLK